MGEAATAWLEATGLVARLVATDGAIVRVGSWPEPLEPPGRALSPVIGSKGGSTDDAADAISDRTFAPNGAPSP
jgi:hypothetical protein